MSQLIPALAATIVPATALLTAALTLRGDTIHSGHHRAGQVQPVPADWTPYDGRVRNAFRHYATRTRQVIA